MAMKKITKTKEISPKVSSHINVSTAATVITSADPQKTLNHKMAERQKQRIYRLRVRENPLLQRLSRAVPVPSKCRVNAGSPSLPPSGLVIQQEEMNMKFQQEEMNRRLELKT